MTWRPLSIDELREMIAHELRHCSDELRSYFASVGFEPAKWRQSPLGDEGKGFGPSRQIRGECSGTTTSRTASMYLHSPIGGLSPTTGTGVIKTS